MTLRVKIENPDTGAAYNAIVRTFYVGEDAHGKKFDHGFSPPEVVTPGQSLDKWISSNQGIRIDEEPILKK